MNTQNDHPNIHFVTCDSCLTLSDKSQQYNSQYLMNYLSSRIPEEETEVSEITVVYDGNANINIKLCSVVCLINIYLHKKITVEDLTVNHLFVYLFYHQHNLFNKRNIYRSAKTSSLGKEIPVLDIAQHTFTKTNS